MAWTLAFILASTGCGKRGTRGCSDFWGCEKEPEPWEPLDIGPPPDLGPRDGGPDMGLVDPPPDCVIGEECTEVRGCPAANAICFEPATFGGDSVGIGGVDDPILGHPDGEDTFVATPIFPGGYCTTSWPQEDATPAQCNLRGTEEVDPVCGGCASCIDIFSLDTEENTDDFVPGFCARRCSPSVTTNECRDGYECLLTEEVCFLGCQTDDECLIARVESNGVPGIQAPANCDPELGGDLANCTPADCGGGSPADPDACANPASNFDALVYDTESEATCDPSTSRCVGAPSDPTASGGDPCTDDAQCEPEGRCIEETDDGRWADGSCTKDRCDLDGNECANDGVCQEAGVGTFRCFEGCTVGGFDTASDPSTWVTDGVAQASCREGYGCYWGGAAPGGSEDNGACLPVAYNSAVTVPNTGTACTEDADCFSPFGNGFCITGDGFPGGYCSVRNCGAPWFTEGVDEDQNVCGEGGLCVRFDAEDPTSALCVQTCAEASECGADLGCVDFTADSKACWPGCATDADCRADERCATAGTDAARCVPE